MAKCLENSECNKMVGNRTIHGFSVKREKGKFVIEMPFGQNGNGKSFEFEVADLKLDPGRFYINFGNYENSMHTYVIRGDTSDLTGGSEPIKDMVKIANNENAKKIYEENDEGMPLDVAQHLWMLGIDILGTEEQQKLLFLTKGEPKTIEFITCNKTDKNLASHSDNRKKFINAMYFMPNAKDIRPLENMHEEGIYVEPKPDPKDLIKVNDMGNEHIEKLPNPLPNIEFFLSGWVPENAANFSILLYHGTEQLMKKLGQKIMEIFVAFDGKNIKECNVTSFLSEEMFQSCNTNDEGKPVAFETGKKFLFWMKIHKGLMEISLNCNQRTFKIGIIPYSPENFIKFTGNLELVIVRKVRDIDIVTDMVNKKSFIELMEKTPVLVVRKIDLISHQNKLFIITSNFAMNKKTHQTKIEILFVNSENMLVNSTNPNIFFSFNIEKRNCSKSEPTEENCITNKFDTCLNIEWTDENKLISEQFCSSSTTFEIIFFCEGQNNQQNAQIETKENKILHMFLNQNEIQNIPKKDKICNSNNMQIIGDLEHPVSGNHFIFLNKYSEEYKYDIDKAFSFNTLKRDQQYVNIHLLLLGKQTIDKKGNYITINLLCETCFEYKELSDLISLRLIIDYFSKSPKMQATTYKENNKSYIKEEIAKNTTGFNVTENPFWLKIFINEKDKNYKIYHNGAHLMDIKLYEKRVDYGTGFKIQGNVALFNKLFIFPYIFKLKISAGLEENSKLMMKWRILKNAELIEFFLAKGPINKIIILGTSNQNKFGLFMHIRAHKSVEKGTVCISSSMIHNSNCPQFVQNQDGEDIKMLDPMMFNGEDMHTLEINFNNGYANIQFDEYDSIKLVAPGNNLLEAEYFVINGDITIIDPPEIIKPTEKPSAEETTMNPPKLNK